MTFIKSQLKTNSKEFKARAKQYQELIAQLEQFRRDTQVHLTTSVQEKLSRQHKLSVDNRLNRLFDPGTARLEIGQLAGQGITPGVPAGAGIKTVIGVVRSKIVMAIANDPTVKGGTYFPTTAKKHLRAQEIAMMNGLPCISLVDSGGAFLPLQSEVFPDRFHFGRVFYNQAQMSSRGIPQISAVLGSCTAGGAYVPAMSDETIMVRGNSSIFLGGPPLVKAATGEIVTAEELGGAEVHCQISGVADYLAESEEEAIDLIRTRVSLLGRVEERYPKLTPERTAEEPEYDPEELGGVLGVDLAKGFSAHEVLARLLDGSRFEEFKANWGSTLRCGFGHLGGFLVGVLINDGILFSESALKGAHFIELCEQRRIPLLFLQHITGFMVGKQYEHEGIAKDGAKMVNAVSTCTVPKFTVIIGSSYGAGNYAMCGRAYEPNLLFTWPNSRISVMGGEQAAQVLTAVKFSEDTDSDAAKSYANEIRSQYQLESSPYYATARMWDDGIITPPETRSTLALALGSSYRGVSSPGTFGVFRM